MNGRFIFRLLVALVAIVAILGLGAIVYNAGVAQGAAQAAQLAGSESGAVPVPYYGPYAPPFFGFGFFGLLGLLFFLFLLFGAMRALFWRGPRGWGHMHRGPWGVPPMAGKEDWSKGVPPPFEEWHRRAHESQPAEK